MHQPSTQILVRKGGIREPVFTPRASFYLFPTAFHSTSTLIKPTPAAQLHDALMHDPRHNATLHVKYAAQVTGAWQSSDQGLLTNLDQLHIWNEEFLAGRLRWRPAQQLTLLELRVCFGGVFYCGCIVGGVLQRVEREGAGPMMHTYVVCVNTQVYQVEPPLVFPNDEDLWGCFSWVDVPAPRGHWTDVDSVCMQGRAVLDEDEFAVRQAALRHALDHVGATPLAIEG